MSVNRFRGEVALKLDGVAHVMRLNLAALAGLEADLGADSLVALVERFEGGRFKAADVIALLLAGLEGGGAPMTREALMAASIEGGPLGAARAAAELLRVTFSTGTA
ncbi:MAG: gene transfer agent family protein [Paracoccaceae bacterium]